MGSEPDLDRILDDALNAYCDVEPRLGFEARVLRHARSARSRRRWLLLLIPAAVAFLIAVAVVMRPVPPPARVVVAGAHTMSTPAPLEPPITSVRVHKVRSVSTRKALPRKNEFPTPSPLTPEERALMILASRSPREAQLLADGGELTPITIPELKIQPLKANGE